MQLDLVHALALAAALGWASGLRLYAVVFLTGLAGRLGWVDLPSGLALLQNPWMLGASGTLLLVEFFVDKVPGVDTLWDVLHTLIRIPAGAALAAAVFGGDGATWTTIAALLGGTLAASSHAAKATTRAAINTSPEPFSNIGASLVGDGFVPLVLWLAWVHPVAALIVVALSVVASLWLCVALGRFLGALLQRLRGRPVAVAIPLVAAILMLAAGPRAQAQAETQLPSQPQAPAEEIVARDMREETQRIAVTVKDMYGRQETRQIPVTIFRPRGEGRFPLLIMNHGRATDALRATQGRERFEDMSRYFVAKGFVVLLPTRVGYAENYGDFDPEVTGTCSARRMEPMADALFDQVMATLEFARTLPYVDASRWVVAGQSAGGMTAVVTVGKHPEGLIAGINFAGGSGGDPENHPQHPCSPQAVERLWRGLAPGATAPMIWFYWQNDQFWGPDIPVQWHASWLGGGGKAEFHSMAAAGKDGHGGSRIDMDHWVPILDEFLVRLGFTKPGLVPRPPPSAFAAIGDVGKVPISAASREGAYRRFLEKKEPRAFAIGPRGAWAYVSGDWAMGKALGRCARRGEECKLYAVDDDVVWVP